MKFFVVDKSTQEKCFLPEKVKTFDDVIRHYRSEYFTVLDGKKNIALKYSLGDIEVEKPTIGPLILLTGIVAFIICYITESFGYSISVFMNFILFGFALEQHIEAKIADFKNRIKDSQLY